MRILVTAGPTREPIDPVRYLSNDSSGRMGFAIARAAKRRGHSVTLVSGPTNLPDPRGIPTYRVVTAKEMDEAVQAHFESSDGLVMAAAVSDFRPRRASRQKIKKDAMEESIALIRNPDIVARAAKRKGDRFVIGFALETENGERNALDKMKRKRLDAIVWNDASAIGARRSTATILLRDGESTRIEARTKDTIANAIVRTAERLLAEGGTRESATHARD